MDRLWSYLFKALVLYFKDYAACTDLKVPLKSVRAKKKTRKVYRFDILYLGMPRERRSSYYYNWLSISIPRGLLVSQFVRDRVRQGDPVVLVDAAAAIRLAHAGDVRHSQGAAWGVRARANVLPRHQNRHVVVIGVRVVGGI